MSLPVDKALRKAQSLIKAGELAEAEQLYKQVLSKFPKNKKAILGYQKLKAGISSEGVSSSEPPQDQAQELINLYGKGQFVKALEKTKPLISLFPEAIILHNIRGASNAALQRYDAAIDSYKQAIKIKPDYADAYSNMGIALKDKGELDAAIDSYKQAIKIKPDYAVAYNNMGVALQDKGELDAAIDSYKQAIKIKSDYSDAYSNMGIALKVKGELDAAIDIYKQAIKIKPGYADAHYNMGNALQDKGELDAAIDSYKQAIKIKPRYADAYYNMGNVLQDKGELDAAIDSYKQAIKIKPDYAVAYCNMGNALKDKGELDAAIDSYKQAIKIKPDYADAYSNMGLVLQDKGELDEAIESYRQALKIKSDHADAYCNMGNALKDKGELDEAIESYRQALKIKSDHADAYSNMGLALQDKGEVDEAIDSYKQAIKIKPDHAVAHNNMAFPLQASKLQKWPLDDRLVSLTEGLTSNYTEIAKAILKYKLDLGSVSATQSLDNVVSLLSNADNNSIDNPNSKNSESLPKPLVTENITALVHFGRSGTGLLHSLIDGHPEVSTLPSIYLSEFFDHSTWKKIIAGGWEEMASRFVSNYKVLFDASSPDPIPTKSRKSIKNLGLKEGMMNIGEQRNEILSVDKKVFSEELNRLMAYHDRLDAFTFFKLVHSAFDKALIDHNKKSLIFYHIHNPDTYAQVNLLRSAPDINWLMMVREPVQSCESWVREYFNENNYQGVVNRIFQMLFEIDHVIFCNKNALGLRLEDLKEHPKKTIPALCDCLGIKETDSLYEMTAQGKKWWGDPASPDFAKDGMNPFGKVSINRKVGSVFSGNDQFVLRTLFYPFSVRFGYAKANTEQFKIDLQAIRPMLDQMFSFERKIVMETKADAEQFMKSGSYLYLRSGMIERWNTLNEFHTYPNMLRPLKIN